MDHHRVRVRDTSVDETQYVTLEKGGIEINPTSPQYRVSNESHPEASAVERCAFHDRVDVHTEDQGIIDSESPKSKAYCIESVSGAIIAILGAAQQTTRRQNIQTGIGDF